MIAVNFGGKDTIFVWFYGKSISLSLYKKICDIMGDKTKRILMDRELLV